MDFRDEVRQNFAELKKEVIEQRIEITKNTQVLMDHHVRTSQLESRFKPVENHVLIEKAVIKLVLTGLTAAAALGAIYHYFLK